MLSGNFLAIALFESNIGKDFWLFGLCYAMDGGYKGWNPYIERHFRAN